MERTVTVNKIGGANMSKLDQVLNLVNVLREEGETPILVVSAFKGVTNILYEMLDQLHDTDYKEDDINVAFQPALDIVKGKIDEFIKTDEYRRMAYEHVLREIHVVKNVLRVHKRVSKVLTPQEDTYDARDKVIAFGERSVIGVLEAFLQENRVMAEAINDVEFHANGGNRTSQKSLHEGIQEGIAEKMREVMHGWDEEVLIIGGHIKGTPRGMTAHLGRNYTDTTAVEVMAALTRHMDIPVDSITMWKDVDGVMSAAPAQLDEEIDTPITFSDVSYDEAAEAAGSGMSLVHLGALQLARDLGIDLQLKNITNPRSEGTTFSDCWNKTDNPFKIIYANEDVYVLSYKVIEMADQHGFLAAMTAIFDDEGVSVIDTPSSGIGIDFTVKIPSDESERLALRKRIRRINNRMRNITVHGETYKCKMEWSTGDANLVIIGDELQQNVGVLAKVSGVLASAGINVESFVQRKPQRRMSFYIPKRDAKKAVQSLHRAFFGKKE
mgnify:FL=1